jgi:hypothetical protein
VTLPLISNPPSKEGLVLLEKVLAWHHAMPILSFKLDQIFMLQVPALVVSFEASTTVIFPNESDSVQQFLSAWFQFVLGVTLPLIGNPLP